MTNDNFNAQIRSELKAAGYNAKQFSVTTERTIYGGKPVVRIKDMSLRIEDIEKVISIRCSVEYDYHSYQYVLQANMAEAKEIIYKGKDISSDSSRGITLFDQGHICVVYYPSWFNSSRPHINILKKPDNYKERDCYCLETLQTFDASSEYRIAEALIFIHNELRVLDKVAV